MADTGFVIDCSGCEKRASGECGECIVSFILDRPEGAVIFDAAEERALRTLRDGGLLPPVRLRKTAG
jgi:hypothetical protein